MSALNECHEPERKQWISSSGSEYSAEALKEHALYLSVYVRFFCHCGSRYVVPYFIQLLILYDQTRCEQLFCQKIQSQTTKSDKIKVKWKIAMCVPNNSQNQTVFLFWVQKNISIKIHFFYLFPFYFFGSNFAHNFRLCVYWNWRRTDEIISKTFFNIYTYF